MLLSAVMLQVVYAVLVAHLCSRRVLTRVTVAMVAEYGLAMLTAALLMPTLRVFVALLAMNASFLVCLLVWHGDRKMQRGHQAAVLTLVWVSIKVGLLLTMPLSAFDSLRLTTRWFTCQADRPMAIGHFGAATIFGGVLLLSRSSSSRGIF